MGRGGVDRRRKKQIKGPNIMGDEEGKNANQFIGLLG